MDSLLADGKISDAERSALVSTVTQKIVRTMNTVFYECPHGAFRKGLSYSLEYSFRYTGKLSVQITVNIYVSPDYLVPEAADLYMLDTGKSRACTGRRKTPKTPCLAFACRWSIGRQAARRR